MAKNKSGQTAFGAATARLIEQYEPIDKRLFNDPVIRLILNGAIVFLMKFKVVRNWMIKMFDNKTAGIFGGLVCRTKYIDDKMQDALDKGIQQVLILGSGMDTRAYRIKMPDKVKVFEIDMDSVQQFKKNKIIRYLGKLPEYVSYAAIDFNTQSIDEILRQNDFDFGKPTFIIWEGVTQYITPNTVMKSFEFISRTAPGSSVVFTYILESVINKSSKIAGAKELMDFFEKRSSPWRFGMEPTEMELFLKKQNLILVEDVGAGYYEEKYLQPMNRSLAVTEIERVALAKVNGQKIPLI